MHLVCTVKFQSSQAPWYMNQKISCSTTHFNRKMSPKLRGRPETGKMFMNLLNKEMVSAKVASFQKLIVGPSRKSCRGTLRKSKPPKKTNGCSFDPIWQPDRHWTAHSRCTAQYMVMDAGGRPTWMSFEGMQLGKEQNWKTGPNTIRYGANFERTWQPSATVGNGGPNVNGKTNDDCYTALCRFARITPPNIIAHWETSSWYPIRLGDGSQNQHDYVIAITVKRTTYQLQFHTAILNTAYLVGCIRGYVRIGRHTCRRKRYGTYNTPRISSKESLVEIWTDLCDLSGGRCNEAKRRHFLYYLKEFLVETLDWFFFLWRAQESSYSRSLQIRLMFRSGDPNPIPMFVLQADHISSIKVVERTR